MGKYSPIGPLPILQELQRINLLGNYLLLLGHDVRAHSAGYIELLRGCVNPFVILDNSAVELGEPMMEELVNIFYQIGADKFRSAIVLPDVMGNRAKTLESVETMLRSIDGYTACSLPWMGIPQGETIAEVIQCAEGIRRMLGKNPSYWGVPRWIANNLGTRKDIAKLLSGRDFNDNAYEPNVHLLGMSSNLDDDITCAKLSGVMGIDSANPIVLGLHVRDIMTQYEHMPRLEVEDHGSPYGEEVIFDYWQTKHITPQVIANIIKLRSVI